VGLFSKEKISKEKSEEEKDKWGSIRCKQANDIYIALKSTNESRAQ